MDARHHKWERKGRGHDQMRKKVEEVKLKQMNKRLR